MKSLLRLSLALLTFTHHSLAHASPSHELPKPAERREGPDIQGILHDLLGDDLSAFSGFTERI